MSQTLNLLTDIPGIRVGHATDLALGSGVTAVLFDAPAVAAVQIGGGAPGTRDTDLLRAEMTVEQVDAIVLSGGSTFGLDAAGGVQAALREDGRGIRFGGINIPLAPQAILFDLLNGGNKDWGRFSPYRDLGYEAAQAAAAGEFSLGSVGAGTGATTATVKGGLGSASAVTAQGHRVAAIVAVNAVGSPLVGEGPASGPRLSNRARNSAASACRSTSGRRICGHASRAAPAPRPPSGWWSPMRH
ncbi:P1 family peptidase [Pseudoroseomonas wenyumeiae]